MKPAVASSPERTHVFRKTHANVCFDDRKSRFSAKKPKNLGGKLSKWPTISGYGLLFMA